MRRLRAAIPATLAESQLFGHVAGSFTGARKDHRGHFQEADGGTLFLDELGELPLTMQPKLLRVLEEQLVTPVGASHGRKVDVRIIAATNLDLQEAVADERFRGDLYARIAEITLSMPSLASRREDILSLLELGLGPDAPPLERGCSRASRRKAATSRSWPAPWGDLAGRSTATSRCTNSSSTTSADGGSGLSCRMRRQWSGGSSTA